MTDGQSIYVCLALFYLLECCKLVPVGTIAIVNRLTHPREWRTASELVRLMGVGKSVRFGALFPWPQTLLVANRAIGPVALKDIHEARNALNRLFEKSAKLRLASMGLFLSYFILLPILYRDERLSGVFLFCLAALYLFQIGLAVFFFRLHRIFLPELLPDRLKNTFYTVLLPWHAMRCADEVILRFSQQWNELTLLGALGNSEGVVERLMCYYREAVYSSNPRYPVEVLRPLFDALKIDIDQALNPPESLEGPKYCPCCWGSYMHGVEECSDCEGVGLRGIN